MLATEASGTPDLHAAPRLGQRLVLANSLKWLAPEIDASLARVRALIDQQQDAETDDLDTSTVLLELKLVYGALRMAGCYGGSLLAQELCAAVAVVAEGKLAEPAAALAAVSGATLQLSDYLDALRHAAPDRAAVLQPAIGELRLACKKVAATEADLFVWQMQLIGPSLPLPPESVQLLASAPVVAAKLLPAFQSLLLQWLKGVDVSSTLLKLRKVGDHIASHAARVETILLWSSFAAAIDSLITIPGAESLELKRWVGRLGQQIKNLAEHGEAAAAPFAPEIAWRLLAHAAPIHHGGTRWLALRHHLGLDATLPVEPALSAARQQMRGPNTRLLEKVADEVRADLGLVKDGLDLALRAGGLSVEAQTSLGERLGRIANTLVLLGLPQLEQVLRKQSGQLATLGSGAVENQGQWMQTATALLRVEHSLETALFRPLRQMKSEPQRPMPPELIESVPHSQDLRESVAALLREMLVDLAKLKAQLDAYLKGGELRDIAEPAQWLGEVASGLIMLDRLAAAELGAALRDWLKACGPQVLRGDPALAVRFAEAVAALELYLEALRDALPQPERMLETLTVALAALAPSMPAADVVALAELDSLDELVVEVTPSAADHSPEPEPLPPPPVAAPPSFDLGASLVMPAAPVSEPSRFNESLPTLADTASSIMEPSFAELLPVEEQALPPAEPAALPEPPSQLAAGDADPEIREIFLEEGQEVLDGLKRALPVFHRDPSEPGALGDIRRAFHTLKGSGRMVGATRLGEFGWAVEHLLNRCIEGSLPVNPAVIGIVEEAVQLLPALLQEFRDGSFAAADDPAQTLIARAHFLASGRAPEMVETDVLDVFRTDALDRLGDVQNWLANGPNTFIDADTVRALHTLKGSASVVNAEPLSQLAGALESVLRQFIAADAPVSPEVRAVLSEALPVLRDWTTRAGQPIAAESVSEWLARVEALRIFVPPPGETRSLGRRETMVNLAFDRLQMVEQRLVAWTVNPIDTGLGREMGDAAEALGIVSQECAPLARGAEALTDRLRADDLASVLPDASFFIALANTLEHFYQFLDSYREGGVRESGRELAELLRRLPLRAEPAAQTMPVVEPAVVEQAELMPVAEMTAPAEVAEPDWQAGSAMAAAPVDADAGRLSFGDWPEPPADELTAIVQWDDAAPAMPPAFVEPPLEAWPVAAEQTTPQYADPEQSAPLHIEVEQPESLYAEPELQMPAVAEPAATDSSETVELLPVPHSVPVPPESVDAELATLFIEEARELLAVLKTDVPAWRLPLPPPSSITHSLHTLTGSARMAGYAALGDMAHRFERRLSGFDAQSAGAPLFRDELLATLPVLEQAIDHFETMLPSPEPAMQVQTMDAFIDSIDAQRPDQYPDEHPSRTYTTEAPVSIELQNDRPPSVADDDAFLRFVTEDPAASSGLLANDGFSDEAGEYNEPASQQSFNTSDSLLHPLPGLLQSMDQHWPEPPQNPSTPSVETPAVEPLAVPAAAAEAIDPELATIFIAEASEMLEAMDTALGDWRRDAGDPSAVAELQRALHTLKGGARMTGFMQMGDLSHDMETRVGDILLRGSAPDASDHAALKADLETLERIHDALMRGQYAEPVRVAEPERTWPAEAEGDSDIEVEAPRASRLPAALQQVVPEGWEPSLFWRPEEDAAAAVRRELARVPVDSLDAMLNEAGEISIYRSRLEQQNAVLVAQLTEMRQTILRLREQLRSMDAETDAQIAARGLNAQGAEADRYAQDFDPLEMDRYSRMQELSRALNEAVGDLSSLHLTMDQGVNEAQVLLLQQGRINTAVQQGLMGTLMVPFSRQVARLQRVLRQTAQEEGKFADVRFEGVESELDRNVLERMTAPLEHLLRNAVVHGLEDPRGRLAAEKPPMGVVTVSLKREGTQLLLEVSDDGRGLNFAAIRSKAIERGLLPMGATLGDEEVARFIFEPGFSTAETLTQSAGRGVGMDVVASEVKQLGGSLELRSEHGQGTGFMIRLPLSLALSQALMVKVGDEIYALPLVAIEGIGRIPRAAALTAVGGGEAVFAYGGQDYRVRTLAELIDLPHAVPDDSRTVPAVLVRLGDGISGGERRAALIVDQLLGNREVISKAVGPQLSSISGVSGATILPSGEVVLVLDPAALVIDRARRRLIAEAAASRANLVRQATQTGRLIMVVDDSITMRRVAERLLQRNGYRVITAKDGLDAIAQLQNEAPAAILLDIEMPRADGFEVAGFVRNNDRISETPIIMITSRSGDKHRTRAATLGVNRYLIKPYQEEQLLHELRGLLQAREAEAA